MFRLRAAAGVVANVLLFAIPLFAIAGTFTWWRAWVIVAVMLAGSVVSVATLPRDTLEARMRPPIDGVQPASDRVLTTLLVLAAIALLCLTPFDARHVHLVPRPTGIIATAGLALFIAGFVIAYLALRENRFATPAVRLQPERGQRVIASGVYACVRHPLYSGGLALMVGLPLWLESLADVVFALVVLTPIFVGRIVFEERFLRRHLHGYDSYAERVRFRFVPYVW